MNDFIIRRERENEQHAVENVIRDAFWDKYSPGCCEHLLVNRMRTQKKTILDLCFIAEYKNEIAGGIWYAEAIVKNADGEIPVLTLGPVGVRPDLQGIGIGAALIRHTLDLASKMDYPAVLLYGNIAYYSRFGFKPAAEFGITDSEGNPCPAILALNLHGNMPSGAFCEGDAYQISAEDARKFDRNFAHRQRHVRSTQLFFVPPGPPPQDELLAESWQIRQRASALLRKSGILEAWEKIGAKIRLVGSYRSDLMLDKDIDLHVYTETLDAGRTFQAFQQILSDKNTLKCTYINGANTDEHCLEFHLHVKDETGDVWTIDMIQILAGSKFDGFFEDTAEAIMDVLTPETRKTIIMLKKAAPAGNMICGIEFYKAVLADHVKTWDEFVEWRKKNPIESMMSWQP